MTEDQWQLYHAHLFGFTSPDDPYLLRSWSKLGGRMGATPEQMREASDAMALDHDLPRYRDQHLGVWRECLRLLLARTRRPAGRSEDAQPPGCELCRSTGRVSVPSPAAMDGRPWSTLAVLCPCPLGRWWAGQKQTAAQMTFRDYELAHPGWRQYLKTHDDELRAYVEAADLAKSNRSELGEAAADVLSRLRARR